MQNLELLQKEKSKLEEVIEILTIEKTARKYIERYEQQKKRHKKEICSLNKEKMCFTPLNKE